MMNPQMTTMRRRRMTEEQLLRIRTAWMLRRSLMLVSGLVLTTSNSQIRRWRRTLDLEALLAV